MPARVESLVITRGGGVTVPLKSFLLGGGMLNNALKKQVGSTVTITTIITIGDSIIAQQAFLGLEIIPKLEEKI